MWARRCHGGGAGICAERAGAEAGAGGWVGADRAGGGAGGGGVRTNFTIARPDLIDESRIITVYRLHREKRIPDSIAGFMLATPLIQQLRILLGSNGATAWYLIRLIVDSHWNVFWQRLAWVLYWAPWLLAWLWTGVWGWSRVLRGFGRAAWLWGRHDSPEPTKCEQCVWRGMRRRCVHAYHDCGDGDTEAMDGCPRCGADI